jgi:hypothetical protein
MVFCCFEWPSPDHLSELDSKVESIPYIPSTDYPGQRPTKYHPTAGNALSAHPLSNSASSYGNNVPPSMAVGASQDLVAGKGITLTFVVMR